MSAPARIEVVRHYDSFSDFPDKGSLGVIYIDDDLDTIYIWDADTNTYVRPDQDLIDRITNLEEINYVKKVYKEITGTTTGQVKDYSPTAIDTINWANAEDNAQVKEIDDSTGITGEDVQTSTGAKVRAVVESNRDYTLSGTPTASKYAIVWQLRGTLKDAGTAEIPSSECLGTITDTQAISENTLQRQASIGTSLNYGGVISINNSDNTKYDISAGSATFVDNYTDPENPIVITLIWEDQIGITVTGLNIQFLTFVRIDKNGDFIQAPGPAPYAEERDAVPLGALIHTNLTFITAVGPYTNWCRDLKLDIADFGNILGPRLNSEGNKIEPFASGTLYIKKTAGLMFGIGANYSINRKNPNISTIAADPGPVVFLTFVRDAVPGGAVAIDTEYYDPNGDGVLVEIPDNFYVTHRIYYEQSTNLTGLQYSQYAYDSLKKATDLWGQEAFEKAVPVEHVELRAVVVVKKSTTSLTDRDVKIIDIGMLGEKALNTIPGIDEFAEGIETLDGMSNERPSVTYVNDAGTIYLDLEADGGGDMIYIFEQREYVLDCTTGSGINGRARIALTAGSAFNDPVQNYSTVIPSGSIAILQASPSFPTGQFGWVSDCLLPDATTFDTTGLYSTQRTSDDKTHDGRGALSYEREKIRILGTSYESGVIPTITVTDLTPDDRVDFETTQGEIYQLHKHTMPALDSASDAIYVINHKTQEWLRVTNIGDIQEDSKGITLNNRSFNFVFIGIKSTANGVDYSKIGILLPSSSYNYLSLSQALADEDNTAITSVPASIKKTAFLIARVTFKYKNGVWNNVTAEETGVSFFDLRGAPLGATTGGAGTPSVTTFSDAVLEIFNNIDTTKRIKFDASGITTATTRIFTVPDCDGTLALATGCPGGQLIYGGVNASDDLTLDSTSNATKGFTLINPSGGAVGINGTPTADDNKLVIYGDYNLPDADSEGHLALRGKSDPDKVLILGVETTNDYAWIQSSEDGISTRPLCLQPYGGNVGIEETAPETSIEITEATPYITLHNDTLEDSDGGRESRISFKGEQSGGEESTLARIQVHHDGTGDDQKGKVIIYTNDGSDGNAPTERMSIDSDGYLCYIGDGTGGTLEIVTWANGINLQNTGTGKHLYINRDAGATSDLYLGTEGNELIVDGANGDVLVNGTLNVGTTNWVDSYNITNTYDTYPLIASSSNITIKQVILTNGYRLRTLIVELHSRNASGTAGYSRWFVSIKRILNQLAVVVITLLDTAQSPAYGLTSNVSGTTTTDNTITISTTGAGGSEFGKFMVTYVNVLN